MDFIIPSVMGYGGRVIASSPEARLRLIADLKRQRQKLLAQYPYKNKFSGKAKSKPVKKKVTSKNKKKNRVRKYRPRVTFIETDIDDDIVYPSSSSVKPTVQRRRITPVLVSKPVSKKNSRSDLLREFLRDNGLSQKEQDAIVRRELNAFKDRMLDVSNASESDLNELLVRIRAAAEKPKSKKKARR